MQEKASEYTNLGNAAYSFPLLKTSSVHLHNKTSDKSYNEEINVILSKTALSIFDYGSLNMVIKNTGFGIHQALDSRAKSATLRGGAGKRIKQMRQNAKELRVQKSSLNYC